MSYMIEGAGSKTLSKCKKWLYTQESASHQLLQLITDVNVDYLVGQVKAGAQMLQVFESHAEHLGSDLFSKYCLPYLTQICLKVKDRLKDEGIDEVPMVVIIIVLIGKHFLMHILNFRLSLPREDTML